VLYGQLGALVRQAATTGLPKLYAPTVQGQLGGLVRFQGRLSASLPWTVTVSDSTGAVVASGSGTGSVIDWTWDASTAARASYTWTMSASDLRPATGVIGTAPVALAIKSLAATPRTISDTTQISYTLTASATVTATLRDAGGHDVTTLFTQQHQPGKQTFKLTATNVPEGHFQLVLTAANGKSTATASVPVVIDRTVTTYTVAPAITRSAVTFSFDLARVADVRLDIQRAGKVVAPVYSATLAPGTQSVSWKATGIPDGVYAGALTTSGPVGTATRTLLFRLDTKPPTLRARSFRALRFWVSEPATVTLVVNGARTVRSVRAGTFAFPHGTVRSVRIFARDAAGNVSRTLGFP
jgi:hypothetical protein